MELMDSQAFLHHLFCYSIISVEHRIWLSVRHT